MTKKANYQDKPGSEIAADSKREGGGPRYEGEGWERAEREEEQKKVQDDSDREEPEHIEDNGTAGAVYGKGGTGLTQDKQVKHENRSRRRSDDGS